MRGPPISQEIIRITVEKIVILITQ